MLRLTIHEVEMWDENNECFIGQNRDHEIVLEHSLVSISKWESKWHKAFLGREEKTYEETLDYIKCMTITQNVPEYLYRFLTNKDLEVINEYIANPMTATTFNDQKKHGSREIITSELIYYWMVSLNIPFGECQKWHLNRLLTLIQVCEVKNGPAKKMSQRDIMKQNAAINAARRKKAGSRG